MSFEVTFSNEMTLSDGKTESSIGNIYANIASDVTNPNSQLSNLFLKSEDLKNFQNPTLDNFSEFEFQINKKNVDNLPDYAGVYLQTKINDALKIEKLKEYLVYWYVFSNLKTININKSITLDKNFENFVNNKEGNEQGFLNLIQPLLPGNNFDYLLGQKMFSGFIINKFKEEIPSVDSNTPVFQKYVISFNSFFPYWMKVFDNQISGDSRYTYYVQKVDITVFADKTIQISYETNNQLYNTEYKEFPPNIPEVDIKNYSNINNKLLILLQVNNGIYYQKANYINLFTPEQISIFSEAAQKQTGTYAGGFVYSRSQNDEKCFLVYRTKEKPESYADIIKDQNIIKKLSIQDLQTSFVDDISPNTKYYYCFRVLDISDTASDASLVYEVEMIDQSGTVYMVQNTFKPEPIIEFKKTLPFISKVRVTPTEAQVNIPDNLVETTNNSYISIYAVPPDGYKYSWQNDENYFDAASESAKSLDKKLLVYNGKYKLFDFSLPENQIITNDIINSLESNDLTYNQLYNVIFQKIINNNDVFVSSSKQTFGMLLNKLFESDFGPYIVFSTKNYNFLFIIQKPNININIPDEIKYRVETVFDTNPQPIVLESKVPDLQKNSILKNVIDKQSFSTSDLLAPDTIFSNNNNQVFKARIESQNSKKKFDVNFEYRIQIVDGVNLLKDTPMNKNFEILKTEPI